jgi:hypothetical protein
MKKYCATFLTLLLLTSCASVAATGVNKTSTLKLEEPISLVAIKNHLPGGVGNQPAYTIYEDSYWDCKYKTENNDLVCCTKESFSSSSPWKYCLLVDTNYNAFAYFELGMNSYRNWPEGKQPIFKRINE